MDKKSLLMFALGIVLATTLTASIFIFQIIPTQPAQIPKQSQASQTLEKFKVSGGNPNAEAFFLGIDAGKEQGIWASNGLDPEFVPTPGRAPLAADIREQATSGIRIGINVPSEVLLAKSAGMPIKIVAGYVGEGNARIYVKGDDRIKTVQDLNGKKIGTRTATDWTYRYVSVISKKFSIKLEPVPVGNLTNQVVALKIGRIDAFFTGENAALRLVDSGELRVLLRISDIFPKPSAAAVIWATDDLIQQNPDLVRRFVKAWLESISYLKENPGFASNLYARRSNSDKNLADKVVALLDWQPSGRGNGQDLVAGVANVWEFNKEAGAIPPNVNVKIEDAVDIRFLP